MRTIITLLFLSSTLFLQAQRGGHQHQHNRGPVPMSSLEFSQAMNQMGRESFDDGKLRIAKGIINGNYLLSAQVKVLVGEFSFKAAQEELALSAYPKTYDQNKYYVVYEAFTYDSSKDRVSDWVSRQPINDYQANHHYGPNLITDADFAEGLHHVRAESFDDGKLRVVKQLIDGNYLYADQVMVLVKEFDFKGNQEQIAKYAYPKTYDQKNYYLIYDAFTYNSSKDELERWLDGQPIKDYARPPSNNHNHGGGHNHGNGHNNNSNHGNNNGGGYNNNSNYGNNNGNGYNNNSNHGGSHNHGNGHNNNSNHGNNNGGGYNNNNNGNGYNNNQNQGNNQPPNNTNPNLGNSNNTGTNLNSNNNNTGTRPNTGNQNNNQGGNIQAMSARDFDTMKARIADFSSDNDRINKAKEYLPNNFLLAAQVKEVMGLFVFEDVRLAFAKASYAKTYDPQNYNLVKSVLINPSSKQALQTYIDNY